MTRAGRHWQGLVAGIVFVLSAPAAVLAQAIPGALPESAKALAAGEWPAYAGTYAAARYSPLTQINKDNAKDLRVAWRWKSPDGAVREAKPDAIAPSLSNQATPLMVGGVLYISTSLSPGCGHRRRYGRNQMGVRSQVLRQRSWHARQQWLGAPRRRLLAQWRR